MGTFAPFAEEFITPQKIDAPKVDPPKAADPAPQPVMFRREIDLHDGAGKQVFEALTLEELADKLVVAQENGTKKIRQLNRQLKQRSAPRQAEAIVEPSSQPKQLSPEEEYLLGQELQTRPAQAVGRILEALTGYKPAELHTALTKAQKNAKQLAERDAAEQFLIEHADDYAPTPKNYSAIKSFLDSENLEMSKDNLEYAFNELSASGLLVPPAQPTIKKAEPIAAQPQPTVRIEPTAAGNRTVSTGLSSRSSQAPESAAVPAELDVEELQRLPLEQARARIVRAMHTQRAVAPR